MNITDATRLSAGYQKTGDLLHYYSHTTLTEQPYATKVEKYNHFFASFVEQLSYHLRRWVVWNETAPLIVNVEGNFNAVEMQIKMQ